METKFKYIKSLDIEQILEQSDGETHTNEYLSYMRNIIEQSEADNARSDKENEGKKMPKRRPKYLDEKIKAREAAEAAEALLKTEAEEGSIESLTVNQK